MDDFAHRRVHGQRKALRNGVADRHEPEGHARKREVMPGVDGDKIGAIQDAPLAQLVADKRESERRAIDRQPLGEGYKPRHCTDMILMPVRENNAGEPFSPGQNGVQRGMTVSTPNCCSSGNMIPQSTSTEPSGVSQI